MISNFLRSLSIWFLGLSLWGSLPKVSLAQMEIRPDNTLAGEASTLDMQGNTTLIEGGATRDINLFHSFDEFNIDEGQAAYFVVDDITIENIFSRITGDDPSDILGTLGTCLAGECNSTKTDTNFYLMNPHGIIFGRNASLDIGGSFVATTANSIEFDNQGTYSSNLPTEVTQLLSINPSAFLFNESNTQLNNSIESFAILDVPEGHSLLLVGGNVNPDNSSTGNIVIREGRLRAPAGRIEIGGLSDIGRIGLNTEDDGHLELSFPEGVNRSDFIMTGEAGGFAELDVTSGSGGDIAIYANNISILNGSDICAGIGPTSTCGSQSASFGNRGSQAGDITINAQETVTLSDPISVIENDVNPNSFGNAGDINIVGKTIFVTNVGRITNRSFGQGNTGNITINAERVYVDDSNIVISIDGVGRAGDLRVYASELIELRGEVESGNSASPGGFLNQVESSGQGSGGDLFVETNQLSISDGSKIQTTTFGDASRGRVGNIDIQAEDIQIFETTGDNFFTTGIFGGVQTDSRNENIPSGGNGGNVTIQTERLRINTGIVSAGTDGIGNAGNLLIRASELVELVDNSAETGSLSVIEAGVSGSATGQGGNLTIETGKIRLFGNSDIRTNVFAEEGSGGNITLVADSIVAFDDSDIFAFAQEGRGGNITLDTPAFFGENYQPSPPGQRADDLDLNDAVNINASGTTSGVVTLPDTVFIQNELVELSDVLVNTDTLVANSCVARRNDDEGNFVLVNLGRSSNGSTQDVGEVYSTGNVQPVDETLSQGNFLHTNNLFVEPQQLYQLNDGRLLMSQSCQ